MMGHRLAFWRSLFALTVHASARFPRLVPMAVVEYADRRFYDACLRETLTRSATESELEAQRRSFAFGQVAMHDPTLTRAQVDAIADTMPAPGNSHCHGCGRVAEHGIAGWYLEPGPFFRLWCPDCDAPFDFLCGEGPELEAEAGEEHAAMVDLHSADIWPHSGDGRKGWVA